MFCYKLCTHPYFVSTILILICCSSILLAAEDPLGKDKLRNQVRWFFKYNELLSHWKLILMYCQCFSITRLEKTTSLKPGPEVTGGHRSWPDVFGLWPDKKNFQWCCQVNFFQSDKKFSLWPDNLKILTSSPEN